MAILLTCTQTQIRYISEWDPRELAHTKGGYLEGVISVPDIPGMIRMELSTHPAKDAEPLIANIHPILLHLVRIGTNRREQELETVPTYTNWRQVFEIEDNKVFILNQLSELDVEKDGSPRKVPARAWVTSLDEDRSIHMSKRKGHLNLILLNPKQRCRANANEVTVTKVLKDRLGTTNDEHVLPYEKMFKGKNVRNLKKLRLKVSFMAGEYNYGAISSQTIIDTGNKDIGALDFVDAHPLKSCSKGGRKVILLSEYNLSKDIIPVFLVYTVDPDTGVEQERPDLEKFLVQPQEVEVRNTQVLFQTPAQTMLENLPKPHKLKLVVRRFGDGHISTTAFEWEFEKHVDGNCLECNWNVDGV